MASDSEDARVRYNETEHLKRMRDLYHPSTLMHRFFSDLLVEAVLLDRKITEKERRMEQQHGTV
jgi:hypothetical protein